MNRKIKILHIPSNTDGGVFYYRTLTPMTSLSEQFPGKYDVIITNNVKMAWQELKGADILFIHNCLYDDKLQYMIWNLVVEAKKIGVKTILDMDDYWNYGEQHPMYGICMNNRYQIKASINFNLFDCITTTTKRLAESIREYNRNVFVLENGISPLDSQFSMQKNSSKRIRIGLTGGASHTTDVMQIISEKETIFDYLPQEYINKIQFVLCGFNTEGKKIVVDDDGKQHQEDIAPEDIWWTQLEKQLTKDYSMVSPEYKDVLTQYKPISEEFDASEEPYRRIWSKSIGKFEYGQIYKDLDVLLVPLTNTMFNSKKSNIKFTEAGFTNTAILTSHVAPYIDYGTDYKNCLFVKDMTPKGWAEKIMEIVDNAELRQSITQNLHNKVVQEHNLDMISRRRDKLFTKLLKK